MRPPDWNDFSQFLATYLGLTDEERPRLGDWSNLGNAIGALALRLNVLTVDQVEIVLERQDGSCRGRPFGAIGVELGYLTVDAVERLLEAQLLIRQCELGEQLVISGRLETVTLVQLLAAYYSR